MGAECEEVQERVSWEHRARLWRRFVGVVACVVLSWALAWFALKTVIGQGFDTLMMESLAWQVGDIFPGESLVRTLVSVVGIVVAMIFVGLVAFVRRRPPLAGRAIGVIVLSTVSVQAVKFVLERADVGLTYVFPNSLPSGHAAVVGAVSVALVMVAPFYWRSVAVWCGWFVMSVVGLLVVALQWHRVADVLVSFLIVGAWALGLTPVELRRRHLVVSHRVMSVLVVLCALVAACVGVVAACVVDVRVAASLSGEGYGFLAFVRAHPVWSGAFSCAGVALVVGVAGAVLHEVDRLSGLGC